MPLILQPVQEVDLAAVAKVDVSAFGTFPYEHLFHPNGHTPAVLESRMETHRKMFSDPDFIYWKVVDTSLDFQMIAIGRWRIYREDEQPSAQNAPAPAPGHSVAEENGDVNVALFKAMRDANAVTKAKVIKGQKRLHLSLLCTLPEHQRRGAGMMLLEKGDEMADQEGLDSWLVASTIGLPLYQKAGFKEVEGGTMEIDLQPFGGKENEFLVHKVMKRPLLRK